MGSRQVPPPLPAKRPANRGGHDRDGQKGADAEGEEAPAAHGSLAAPPVAQLQDLFLNTGEGSWGRSTLGSVRRKCGPSGVIGEGVLLKAQLHLSAAADWEACE